MKIRVFNWHRKSNGFLTCPPYPRETKCWWLGDITCKRHGSVLRITLKRPKQNRVCFWRVFLVSNNLHRVHVLTPMLVWFDCKLIGFSWDLPCWFDRQKTGFAEGIVAEIDRYSDRYRTNKRANRVPLNSVLKLTGAAFPVELLGQGRNCHQLLTRTAFFRCFEVLFVDVFEHVCTSYFLILVISIAGRGRGRGILPPGSTPWLLQTSLAKTG